MLELKVIRKSTKSSHIFCLGGVYTYDIWKITNRVISSSYSGTIYIRIFNKLYSSRFIVGDLDYYC